MKKKKIMERKKKLNQKGVALIWVYLLSAFLATMIYSFYNLTIWQTKTDVVDSSAEIQAFYLAESAVDEMYHYINANVGAAEFPTISDNLGTGRNYTASYDPATQLVNAIGTVSTGSGSIVKKLSTKIVVAAPFDVPPAVKGGLTANANLTLSGMLIVDGRNHAADGSPIEDEQGIPGLAYYQDNYPQIDESGSVNIGGPTTEPSNPIDPTSLLALSTTNYLTSPEAVFGLIEGDLDSFKNTSLPSSAINGVYYYTAPRRTAGLLN